MFLNLATKIFRITLRYGPEPLLLKILVKVNILSMLKTAYKDVSCDSTCAKMLRAESFLLSLKEFALDVEYIQISRGELTKINGFLELFDSWKVLKKGLLGSTDDPFRLTTTSSVSLFMKTRSRKNSPAENKFIEIPNDNGANMSKFKKESSSTVSLKKLIEQKGLLKNTAQEIKMNTERGNAKRGSFLEVPGRGEKTERRESQEPLNRILLPLVVAKENTNHRSQTALKVRHKSNLRV